MKTIKILERIASPFFKDIFPLNIVIWKFPIYNQLFFLYNRYFSKYYNFEETINYNDKFRIICRGDRGSIDSSIIILWEYETTITNLITKNLENIDICIDIWWNIWYYTLLISSLSDKKIPIYTFEPVNHTFNILKRNIELNHFNNVQLFNIALWNKNENIEIILKKELWHNSLVSDKNTNTSFKQIINIKRWDEVIWDEVIWDITSKNILIKIDVEWYEFEALKWLENILQLNNCEIFLEYTPIFFQNLTNDINKYCIEFLKFFTNKSYRIYDIENNLIEIKDIEDFVNNFKKEQTNLFIN